MNTFKLEKFSALPSGSSPLTSKIMIKGPGVTTLMSYCDPPGHSSCRILGCRPGHSLRVLPFTPNDPGRQWAKCFLKTPSHAERMSSMQPKLPNVP
jgi:hypothetical protein